MLVLHSSYGFVILYLRLSNWFVWKIVLIILLLQFFSSKYHHHHHTECEGSVATLVQWINSKLSAASAGIYKYISMYMCIYIYVYIYIHICMYLHIFVYILCNYIHLYIFMYIYIYYVYNIYIYSYINMYTYRCMGNRLSGLNHAVKKPWGTGNICQLRGGGLCSG
jgi:hypothetical protein